MSRHRRGARRPRDRPGRALRLAPVRPAGAALLFTLLASAAACGESAPATRTSSAWAGSVDTLADGRVVVTNAGGGAWSRDTVRAGRTLLLGETGLTEGRAAYTFGSVSGLAIGEAGRLYVADEQASTVRAYGPDGGDVRLVGGRGEGPGEFRTPLALATTPDGGLLVADLHGGTRLAPRRPGGVPDSVADAWMPPVSPPHLYRPLRLDRAGIVHWPHSVTVGSGPGRPCRTEHLSLRVEPGGAVRDTVRVPAPAGLPCGTPSAWTDPTQGRMLPGLDHVPFAALPSWDVTPGGTLLLGEARRYRLLEVGPGGDTLRVVRREGAALGTVPEALRDDSVATLRARLDTLDVPSSRLENVPEAVLEVRVPETYPAHGAVRVGTEGRIWVERWMPDDPRAAPYDVFAPDGVYLGTVVLPRRFADDRGFVNARRLARPVFTPRAAYGVVKDPATGVQRVARYSYSLPEREEG